MHVISKIDLQNILSEKFGKNILVESISPVGGGCINETAKVKTSLGIFFAKWNDAKQFPKMLEAEAKGLQLLKDTNEIKVPEVISQKTTGNTQYFILEFIESSSMEKHFWYNFGKSLAKLHQHSSEKFGLDHNNYIGSLPQSNRQHSLWSDFFILERLEPQIKSARDNSRIGNIISQKFSKLFSQLEKIFPPEKPALLHGDLWSGNYMIGNNGEPVFIDPAIYFGHREMDLAMTKLFGGFSAEFYESYHEEFPLEKDWQKRIDICNLYPLMVHVNLFGGSYAMQVENILRKF
ncbi:MAG: fructosamine kinase family protein [Bacteroidetes bacterium]|nr:fructosamine kinase family protein [Bacteroidota bacterium]